MQIYLVGGAVRDQLLGVPVHEHDWVVTGATPEQMIKLGYQQVGSDFPVFLHPKTRDEYALARTERKQGSGYTGFICNSDSSISLEQDLIRRDLTINAIAQDNQGKLIDPYGGQKDLANKVLRHISDAFVEDPLRVLRVARFAARYHHLGFTVAPETMTLMTDMAKSGELNHLKPERVWKELSRSLLDPNPRIFIEVLRDCGALAHVIPELDVLWGIPNPVQWHPEIDTGIHTLMVLAAACQRSPDLAIRFGALVHDLGKAATPPECWPSHKGHETLGVAIIEKLCSRLRVPNDCRDLAVLMSQHHSLVHRLFDNSAEKVLQMFDQCDLWRKPERFNQLLICCESDFAGRKGFEDRPYPQRKALEDCANNAQSVNIQAIIADGHKGAEIKTELSRQRTIIIKNVLAQHQALI